MPWIVAAIALIALLGWCLHHARATLATAYIVRPTGPSGIVVGADGFVLEHVKAPAVLLLHGAGDTPQTLRYLAGELHRRGFHVVAPLLPGHGRNLESFARVTADEIVVAARTALAELRADRAWVGVIGISMGGAIAARLAADTPDLPALGLASPYLAMPPRIARVAALAPLWGPFVPVMRSAEGISLLDGAERARSLAYGVFTPGALRALATIVRDAAAALPRVAAPTLVVQSREDNRNSVSAAERAFARLGAR